MKTAKELLVEAAKELLVEAQEYLSDERHIVIHPHHLFETPEGVDLTCERHEYVKTHPKGNCRVCLLGALARFTIINGGNLRRDSEAFTTAMFYLDQALTEDNFDTLRDATPKNHTRMLKIYARAIELAKIHQKKR